MSDSEVADRDDGLNAALSLFAMGHGIVDPQGLKCLEHCSRPMSLSSVDADQASAAADDAPRASSPGDGVVRETGGRPPPKKRLAEATAAAAAAESKLRSLAEATAVATERLAEATAAAEPRRPSTVSHEEMKPDQAPPPPHPLGAVQADPKRLQGYVSYEEMRRRAALETGTKYVPLGQGKPPPKKRAAASKPGQPKHVSYEEMKRLMRVYGPAKCVRNRSLPGKTEKPPSVRRKFYRWFPDFKERFELTPDGVYAPKIGHDEELRRREESRRWDQALLAAKRNAGRWQEKESKAIDDALNALENK